MTHVTIRYSWHQNPTGGITVTVHMCAGQVYRVCGGAPEDDVVQQMKLWLAFVGALRPGWVRRGRL